MNTDKHRSRKTKTFETQRNGGSGEKHKFNHKGHEGTQRDCPNCHDCQRSPKLKNLALTFSCYPRYPCESVVSFLDFQPLAILAFLAISMVVQYSTLTRNNPLAGAVAAAAERSRSSRMRRTSATVRLPLPTMRNVPTRLRTMWWRNPLPRTV
jgi:hypothetical protein